MAMSRAIVLFKHRAKKGNRLRFFLVWLNNKNNNRFSLSIICSRSNSNSYGMAKSLIIAVAKANPFSKLQMHAKLKTKLYLKAGLD